MSAMGPSDSNSSATPPSPVTLTERDLTNLMRGRDVLVAREVDALCDNVKSSPERRGGLSDFFNNEALFQAGMSASPDQPKGLAILKTLQKPEFRDVREFFQKVGDALQKAVSSLEDNPDIKESGPQFALEDGIVKFNPEVSELLVCSPGFMDPLVGLKNVKPVNPETMERFEKAVEREERKLNQIADKDFQNGTDRYGAEMDKIARGPLPFSFK
ncbi:MAG: hypothetical protein HYU57_10095 [Micavibrio aeruginosavorus]|nr:hypothetical protein [Micavibrio aeruginosavorus]